MKKKQAEVREICRQRVAEQEKSGQAVRAFCRERGIGEHSFYQWRVRLRGERPVTFALVDTGREGGGPGSGARSDLELVLARGERLRISTGADLALLRSVVDLLRA